MKKNRLLMLTVVIAAALGLVTASLVAASSPVSYSISDADLRIVSEETGLVAFRTAVSPQCTYDAGYALYLCPETASTNLPQPNPAAHAEALRLLDTTGLLLIPESTNDRVMAFDPMTGDLVDANFIPTDTTNLSTPIHAILGPDGDSILVSDQLKDAVQQYDMTGNFMGTFAGGNTAILDNIRGIALRPNGNLLVTVASSANAHAVAEFDTSGAYIGNFVANGSGGLDSPFDVYGRTSDWLVNGINSDAIHRYDLSGAYLDNLTAINSFPEQGNLASNGNVLVANFSGTETGIVEYTSAGGLVGIYNPASLSGYRGVYELPNGNLLVTTGSGVHEIDRSNNLIETKISGVSGRFIEYVGPSASIALVKTVGTDSHSCASTSTLIVIGATDLTYCYTVTNSGSITLTTHNLVDDQLGSILVDLPYSLTPGSSVFVTTTANIAQTTVNTATWTASGNGVTTTATAMANVTVLSPSITLTKTVGTDASSCASSSSIIVEGETAVYYCYTVTNTGGVTLTTHDLVDDQLGSILVDLPYSLTPGSSVFVTSTANLTQTTMNTAVWTASGYGLITTATSTASVTVVNPAIALTKTVSTDAASCASSDHITVHSDTIVYYCYTVTNTGDVTLSLHDLNDSELGDIFASFTYTLTPGMSMDTVTAGMIVSATITETTTNTATWTAYAAASSATAMATATVSVQDAFMLYLPSIIKNE